MEQFVSQDPRSYSLHFDLEIRFRARNVCGIFEKRATGPAKRATCTNFVAKSRTTPYFSATNFRSLQKDDLLQDRWNVGSKTRKHRSLTRVAVIMQIKLHVSVARFTVPLDFACSITFAFVRRFDKMAWIVVSQISC